MHIPAGQFTSFLGLAHTRNTWYRVGPVISCRARVLAAWDHLHTIARRDEVSLLVVDSHSRSDRDGAIPIGEIYHGAYLPLSRFYFSRGK